MIDPPPPHRPAGKQQISGRQVFGIALLAFIVVLAGTGFFSCYTYVSPQQVAVIKNNFTGSETVRTDSGLVLHMPWGMTDVFLLDRTEQVFTMTKHTDRGDRASVDNVRIKLIDGSNIDLDVDVNYKIVATLADEIIKRVGPGDSFKNKMVRSYARALIREKYGTLTLEEVADPSTRTRQNLLVKNALNEALRDFGIEVTLVNTTNFVFNPRYETLVKEKKAATQSFINQTAAQERAQKEQETKIAQAEREKNNALITARGSASKRLVEAEARAKQKIARAQGDAYSRKLEGEREYQVALNDAKAVEREGLNTAAGIQKLADAYEKGGTGLVKEALARKLAGARINGRPYSMSERIERFAIGSDKVVPAATRRDER